MIQTAHRDKPSGPRPAHRLVVQQFWHWHSGEFAPAESWAPAVNLYHLERRIELCIDLAGVDPASIDLRVEPERLIVRGCRAAPEPREHPEPMRIVTMEIDHGPFSRGIPLPAAVDVAKVASRYDSGLLWVSLPLREHA